jgi:hypothetical protein
MNSETKHVISYIKERIPEATVKEEHNKMIHFRVTTSVPLYKMFSVLEEAREQLLNLIEDYTVTQVTLDDVFVNFAKIQQDNQTTDIHCGDDCIKRNVFYRLFQKKKKIPPGKFDN